MLVGCLRSKQKWIPDQYQKITSRFFKTVTIDIVGEGDNLSQVIVQPTKNVFVARLAEEYLKFYGARRLISYLQRCKKEGPWRETTTKRLKSRGVSKIIHVGRLENELRTLEKINSAKILNLTADLNRIEELNNLMSESLAQKSDNELEAIARKWIDDQKSDQS